MDTIRVLRVLEYVGPREEVERVVALSIHGERQFGGVTMRAATVGTYPEILDRCAGVETGVAIPDTPES